MNIKRLTNQISTLHNQLYQKAVASVNIALTVRNWCIGAYIVEYEQNGEDRAAYGTGLMPRLAKEIGIKGLSETNLKQNRIFYLTYPHLYEAILELDYFNPIRQSPTDELQSAENEAVGIHQPATDELKTTIEG